MDSMDESELNSGVGDIGEAHAAAHRFKEAFRTNKLNWIIDHFSKAKSEHQTNQII